MSSPTEDVVRQRAKQGRTCIIYSGNVYDVTDFVSKHPGGVDVFEEHSGQDVTEAMHSRETHKHSKHAFTILEKYCVGKVQKSSNNGVRSYCLFDVIFGIVFFNDRGISNCSVTRRPKYNFFFLYLCITCKLLPWLKYHSTQFITDKNWMNSLYMFMSAPYFTVVLFAVFKWKKDSFYWICECMFPGIHWISAVWMASSINRQHPKSSHLIQNRLVGHCHN